MHAKIVIMVIYTKIKIIMYFPEIIMQNIFDL